MTSHKTHAHQIVFRYGYDAMGMHVAASSLDAQLAQGWYGMLRDRIRLQEAESGNIPKTALTYLVFDKTSVVLWRYRTGETNGRNDSRALLGPAEWLKPGMAIGLTSWPGWSDPVPPEPTMQPIPLSQLTPYQDARRDYEQIVLHESYRHTVTEVLARMLDEPGRPVSVIGFDRSEPPVVWALMEAGNEALRARGVGPTWTFSTWETRHDNSVTGLPEIVFLPEPQRNPPASINRVQVAVAAHASASEESYRYADALFRHRFLGEPRPSEPEPTPPHSLPPPKSTLRLPEDRPVARAGPSSVTSPALVESAKAEVSRLPQMPHVTAPSQAAASVDGLGGSARSAAARTDGGTSRPVGTTRPSDLLAAKLMRAGSVAEFLKAIEAARSYATTAALRRTMRKALMDQSGGLERVATFVDDKASAELADAFVNALFGDDAVDLKGKRQDARADAADMISQSQSPLLARRLAEIGIDAEGQSGGPITMAAAGRLTTHGESPAVSVTRRWMAERSRRLRAQRGAGIVGAVAAVALLAATFLAGGVIFRGNGPDAEVATRLAGLQSAVEANKAPPTAVPTLPTFPWTAIVGLDQGLRAVAYVTQKDGSYSSGECEIVFLTPPRTYRVTCQKVPNAEGGVAVRLGTYPRDRVPADVGKSASAAPGAEFSTLLALGS